MPDPIPPRRSELHALHRRYDARPLEPFASAARGTFDPATSDIPLLFDIAYNLPT